MVKKFHLIFKTSQQYNQQWHKNSGR